MTVNASSCSCGPQIHSGEAANQLLQLLQRLLPIPSPPLHNICYPFPPLRNSLSRPLHPRSSATKQKRRGARGERAGVGRGGTTHQGTSRSQLPPLQAPALPSIIPLSTHSQQQLSPLAPPLLCQQRTEQDRAQGGQGASELHHCSAGRHPHTKVQAAANSTLPLQYAPDTRIRLICC